MPALEDTDDELEKEGIFSVSNEDIDFTNLEEILKFHQLQHLEFIKIILSVKLLDLILQECSQELKL